MKVTGIVIKGLGKGKKLGFPTLNLSPRHAPKKLKFGIYAAYVETPAGKFLGAVHYGPRPATAAPTSLEVYCIGLKKNLYGKRITIIIKKRLRSVRNFPTLAALKKQIQRDVVMARKNLKNAIILHGFGNSPSSFWYPYVKKQLEKRGYDVWVPHLPGSHHPTLKKWLPFVLQNGFFSDETIVIGHSAGAPLILSILEAISVTIQKAILVSGFMERLPGCANDLIKKTYRWGSIRRHAQKIICINSDNDPWGCDAKQGRKIAQAAKGRFILRRGEGHMGSTTFHQPYRKFPFLLKWL